MTISQEDVERSPQGEAFVTATLNPLPAGVGTTTITWRTADGSWAQVYVSDDGGPETLFVEGPTGFKIASWIQAGRTYEFRLYAGREHKDVLATVTVTRRQPFLRTP